MFAGYRGDSYCAALISETESAARSSAKGCAALLNTRKYREECHGPGTERPDDEGVQVYQVLITGFGGSGSNLVASALRQVGVTIGHEYMDVRCLAEVLGRAISPDCKNQLTNQLTPFTPIAAATGFHVLAGLRLGLVAVRGE